MLAAHLVIGASGAIGGAVTVELARRNPANPVFAVARQHQAGKGLPDNVRTVNLATSDEAAIADWVSQQKLAGIRFSNVICTTGMLHGEVSGTSIQPEKKLEDLSFDTLQAYFAVNTVIPALWLKALVTVMTNQSAIACLTARVGSISDNRLGGWYGYRASKAALNMVLKTAAVEYARRSKGTAIVSYHPGTVDSGLSSPFQANVPEGKLFTPQFTAERLLDYLQTVEPAGSPHFIDWQHKPIDW